VILVIFPNFSLVSHYQKLSAGLWDASQNKLGVYHEKFRTPALKLSQQPFFEIKEIPFPKAGYCEPVKSYDWFLSIME